MSRYNVYAEELTTETELVSKVVDAGTPNERTFYGVRVFLKSPLELHHNPGDDDRSAVTFWVPWTNVDGHNFGLVQMMLINLHDRVADAIAAELDHKINRKREQEPAVV